MICFIISIYEAELLEISRKGKKQGIIIHSAVTLELNVVIK